MTLLVAVACGSGEGSPHATGLESADSGGLPAGVPWTVTSFPDVPEPADNPSTPEKVALGRLLFYDPVVSADGQVACATCHSEVWGMTDGLPVSVGIGAGPKAGPGRTGPHRTRRNAPTLWNVAFRERVFWDGRGASLEDQVHFPFDSADEFARPLSDVVASLRAIPDYVTAFAGAFPSETPAISETTVARAIAAFERKIVARRGLFAAYLAGDALAMDDAMLSGMRLFAEEGCPTCHAPPLFDGPGYADRGIAPIDGVADAGRFEFTGDEADRNRFETPTLWNLHDSAPYFHTGAVGTALEAVRAEVARSVATDGARALTDSEIQDLDDFLEKGLFDSRNSPTRPYEVPSGLPVPIDGFAIRR